MRDPASVPGRPKPAAVAGLAATVAAALLASATPLHAGKPGPADPYAGLHLYSGDTHVHSGLALYRHLDPDNPHSIGTADEILDMAIARNLDFVAITEHSNNVDDPLGRQWREENDALLTLPDGTRTSSEWTYLQSAIARYNRPGRFVAFLGLEYTRGTTETASPGHQIGIFPGDTLPRYCSNFPHNAGDCPTARDFFSFVAGQKGIAIMAHPCAKWGPSDWSEIDPVLNSMELVSGKCEFQEHGYNEMLGKGLKIGARGSSDSHYFQVGNNDKTMCFARELTREALLDAMRANLCYFIDRYPVTLKFSINGSPMGSEIRDDGSGIAVRATAETDWDTDLDHMTLIHDGKVALSVDCEDSAYAHCALSTFLLSGTSGYYYVSLSSYTGRRIAISSPIWVTTAP